MRLGVRHYMVFVRFRQQGRRLQASLVDTRRVAGKMQSEHIAGLGTVDADVSVRERIAFWAKLPERLARLGNRVGPDAHAKIYGALHARIPMVTPDEQRALQDENAEAGERFWDTMRDVGASLIEGHKAVIATAETAIAGAAPMVSDADEALEAIKGRREKIRRGENVAGGLGKPLDMRAALIAAGFEPDQLRRAELLASLTKAEFETLLARTNASELVNKASDREARRILRARK
jgi:hypothetical protein